MISFPNIKINIGLNIISKLESGYHNIETVMFPINHYDILEILPSHKFELINKGIQINCKTEENLCYKAFKLLKDKYNIPEVKIILYKNIPFGTGLGAGSSNASQTLRILNNMFELNISKNELLHLASKLGADCPFFILNKACYSEGIGDILTEINLDLSGKFIVLCFSDIAINTRSAYQKCSPKPSEINIQELVKADISTWRQNIHNDFEDIVFSSHKTLEDIKNELYHKGAVFAQMTGSGSCIFGIFEDKPINLELKNCKDFRIVNL